MKVKSVVPDEDGSALQANLPIDRGVPGDVGGHDGTASETEGITGSWMLDLRDRTVRWSPEMYAIFGVDPATFVPDLHGIEARVHPDDVDTVRSCVCRWETGTQPSAFSYRVRRSDGEDRLIEIHGWQDTDDEGRVTRALGTAHDVSESVALTRERERLGQERTMILQQVQALGVQRGTLLRDLAAAEERERLRIAADLHDDTIQSLDAVRLRLERVGADVEEGRMRDAIGEARAQLGAAAERLRHQMFDLLPPMAKPDLPAAVETYCSVMFAGSPMTYEVGSGPSSLTEDQYVLAYRLIQEAIRNALKHSQGTRLSVEFELTSAELLIKISDDGIGMPGTVVSDRTHAGLQILRRRAAAIGGDAAFGDGLAQRGFSVDLRLPLDWTDTR